MKKLLDVNGKRTARLHSIVNSGLLLWDKCGMARNAAGLQEALGKIPELREEFWKNVRVPGEGETIINRSNAPGAWLIFSNSPN